MFRFLFLEDAARLYRQGLLPGACWRVMTRPLLWLAYAVLAAVFLFLSPHSPMAIALLVFGLVFATGAHATESVVRTMTPLCFGSFVVGRLNRRYVIRARYSSYCAEFMLIPAVDEPLTLNLATGTEGVTYLLMRHPAEPSILLAIVDDDPRYMKHIMVFATAERRTEIKAEMRTADARGAA